MKDVDVDWKSALESVGIPVPKNQFSLKCPFHQDNHPSASINVQEGVWVCYVSCGSGNLRTFLQRYLNKSSLQVDLLLREFERQRDSLLWNEASEVSEENFEQLEVKFPFIQAAVPQWIFERGFTRETLLRWECGSSDDGALAIPIRDENKRLVGWVTRSKPGSDKRYLYSPGLKTSRVLFGRYNIESEKIVCLTEGSLDTMWLDQNGFASVALLGLHLSRHQERLLSLMPIGELVLCLDNDAAGREAIALIASRLSSYFPISFISLPNGIKDVQEVRNSQELRDIISQRTIIMEA